MTNFDSSSAAKIQVAYLFVTCELYMSLPHQLDSVGSEQKKEVEERHLPKQMWHRDQNCFPTTGSVGGKACQVLKSDSICFIISQIYFNDLFLLSASLVHLSKTALFPGLCHRVGQGDSN